MSLNYSKDLTVKKIHSSAGTSSSAFKSGRGRSSNNKYSEFVMEQPTEADENEHVWFGTSNKCMKVIPIKVGVIIIGILCVAHAFFATYELISESI